MKANDQLLELLRLSDGQLTDIRTLFSQVFRHEIAPELLAWKYAEGRGQSWIARLGPSGEPLVHCGVFFRDILFHGRPVRAAQLVDLMAAPKYAGLSRKNSPFAQLLARILKRLPADNNPDAITFGFPSGRSMRLAEFSGVAIEVDRWVAMTLAVAPQVGVARVRAFDPESSSDCALADSLWASMRRDFSGAVLGIRDFNYLKQRYLRHPTTRYALLVVESRWLGKPLGLAVTRHGEAQSELLDIVGRWEDMPEILRAIQNWMPKAGREGLVMYLTVSFANQLAPFVHKLEATEFRIMGNPFCSESILADLRGRWWLTGGDTDYR